MSPKGPVGAPKQTVSIPAAESTPSALARRPDRKSTRLNSSHSQISYAVFCLKKKKIESLARPAGKPQATAGPRRSVSTGELLVAVCAHIASVIYEDMSRANLVTFAWVVLEQL